VSVLELKRAFDACISQSVPGPHRVGDIAACWADAAVRIRFLAGEVQFTVEDMCRDTWRWVYEGRVYA
jgi:UDP-glucose 4-epimerase